MPNRCVFKRHPLLSLCLALSLASVSVLPVEAATYLRSSYQQTAPLSSPLWGQLDSAIVEQTPAPRLYQVRLLLPQGRNQHAKIAHVVVSDGGLRTTGNGPDAAIWKAQ
ncbi:hypothetical protein DBR00_00795 [Pseudomonas sp. HMWF032]|uniref:hypothetical protein n=1 Tax=unclassified Pseudomonas TaxID=196821 RepID=UPI000D333EEA|nr:MULTISPECIES: hypothetical protein [unclassified Pseudomonas]PTS86630.1 hypothetical protein DBR00_00795 [Pseudomonas sp. HMWF032]PTT81886.1 hypothetical protein DBR41_15710 [Pseudomonas sp. HMWF010]WAC44476.1 hypothetical protein OU997_19970 [Pseudomonas sp. SL4(2022)]